MNKSMKRIQNELRDLENNKNLLNESGIYFHYDEENIRNLYVMIIGSKDTPYEDGYFLFSFYYPDNYPMVPPIAKYWTQGLLYDLKMKTNRNIRFNPNLYTCGKVCLSMLNTWTGPGWVPCNTITNVFIAIQALVLTENPLENEPGLERDEADTENQKNEKEIKYGLYNQFLRYSTYKVGIKEMLINIPEGFEVFEMVMRKRYMENRGKIIDNLRKWKNEVGEMGECPIYKLTTRYEYDNLIEDFENLEFQIE